MKKLKQAPELKLSIGLPQSAPAGHTNIANVPARWPYKDGSVSEIFSHYYFQRVPGPDRGTFMDEMHRVLVPGGKATIIVPYYTSMRATMDYRYEWPPISEMSFLYFNKGWRESQKIADGPSCDFDFNYGYFDAPETTTRSQDVQVQRRTNYWNAVLDLQVVMTLEALMDVSIAQMFEQIGRLYVENTYLNQMVAEHKADLIALRKKLEPQVDEEKERN